MHVKSLLVATLSLVTVCATAVPGTVQAQTLGRDGAPITNTAGTTFQVVAHRGGSGQWPENSVVAYSGSGAAGYDAIETDLAFTKDGVGVMSHDDTLPERCTNAGSKIHLMTLSQVQAVRCADLEGNLVVPIPTFAELAGVLAQYPTLKLTLDLKSYDGHSGSGRATYATRAMALLKKHGLVSRTRIVTYYWRSMLPSIRKASKSIYVVAYDAIKLDLARVRKAKSMGANGYGIRMVDTSAFLARYVRAVGLELVPWQISGTQQRAFSIYYAGRTHAFLTDHPASLQSSLVAGKINLNPVASAALTELAVPVTISTGVYKAGVKKYPLVIGPAVPATSVTALDTVRIVVAVTGGRGTGRVYAGPRSGSLGSVSKALPKGSGTLTMSVPVGDDGKIRVYTTSTVTLSVAVAAYTNIRFS